jgi:hypothetical protein
MGVSWVVRALSIVVVSVPTNLARAEVTGIDGRDIASVFAISKSENRNLVDYGIHADRQCRPVGAAPIYAYWRMYEHHGETEPLLDIEQRIYGLVSDQSIAASDEGSVVRATVRSMPNRPIEFVLWATPHGCRARARMHVLGSDAWLDRIFVRVAWPFGIDSVSVFGERVTDGLPVQEKIHP